MNVICSMNEPTPHTYSIAIREYRQNPRFKLGLWLVIALSSLIISNVFRGGFLSGLRPSIWILLLSVSTSFCTGRTVFVCSRCVDEIKSTPPVCHRCRCKCLPQNDWQSSRRRSFLELSAIGITVLAVVMMIWALFHQL